MPVSSGARPVAGPSPGAIYFELRVSRSFVAEQPRLLGLIVGIGYDSRIFGLLQVYQLLANRRGLCVVAGAAAKVQFQTARQERQGGQADQ